MTEGKNFALATKYLLTFEAYLMDREILLNAGQSVHVEVAETLGRGKGEGVMGITNQRFLFVYHGNEFSVPLVIDGVAVIAITRNWILLPGSSNLKVVFNSNSVEKTQNFYVGNHFSREIISLSKEWTNEI